MRRLQVLIIFFVKTVLRQLGMYLFLQIIHYTNTLILERKVLLKINNVAV